MIIMLNSAFNLVEVEVEAELGKNSSPIMSLPLMPKITARVERVWVLNVQSSEILQFYIE